MIALRPFGLGLLLAAALLPAPAAAVSSEDGYALIRALMAGAPGEKKSAEKKLTAAKDLSLVPPLVDALFFTPTAQRATLLSVLRALTGENPGSRYYDWVELVGRRSDLRAAWPRSRASSSSSARMRSSL